MTDEVDALEIEPLERPPDATVELPGSKSITNRALLCAALAPGRTVLEGALVADDTEAMVSAVGAWGARTRAEGDSTLVVDGVSRPTLEPGTVIQARMSGTTARFVAPVVATAVTAAVVDAHPQMRSRPMGDLISALQSLGVTVLAEERPGHLPLHITGPFTGDEVRVPGDVSSQFLSGLLLAGPLTDRGLTVSTGADLVSRPYVDMTVAVMREFGATVEQVTSETDELAWRVAPGGYQPVGTYRVEPDASAASYFWAAAAMTGGRVCTPGLDREALQGDVAFLDVLAALGAHTEWRHGEVEVRGHRLEGAELDMSEISDTAPTLAAVAAFAEGPTTVRGIGFIRGKESDRVAGPVAELNRLGVAASETADGFVVTPSGPPHGARVRTYGDHRMAMAFALVGLVVPGVVIEDPGCVAKTFPGYFEALDQLR